MLTTAALWVLLSALHGALAQDDTASPEESSEATAASQAQDVGFADAPATAPPPGSLWEWIARMEGEIPDEATAAAIQELSEEAAAEAALLDDLPDGALPEGFFQDPTKAISNDPLFLDQVDPSEFDIPIVVNDSVRKWVAYFVGDGRKYYARWLARSTKYRPLMYEALEARGMPRDLVYLSMIESGYNPSAYSSAAAAGLWQFIPSTARLYKLRVDWWIDERRDPILATKAGLDFLDELHKMFHGDWELAWASYNTGPGRVRRARISTGLNTYWEIAAANKLHPETANYVPKIMAAAIIGKHPERYGFTDIAYQEPYRVDTVRVDGSVDLDVLAKCAGISRADLEALNPALRRWASPPDGVDLRLPPGTKDVFVAKLAEVPQSKRVAFVRHRVQKGETLSVIAKRYGVEVSQITKVNRLQNANRIYVGMTLVIPTAGGGGDSTGEDEPEIRTSSNPAPRASGRSTPATHRVSQGDTLSGIAARYSVSQSDLRAWNGLKGSTIYVGQELKLKGTASGGGGGGGGGGSTITYTIQRGDSLSGIASKHGVSTADLQRWNNISNASHIQVGQKLTVHTQNSGWTTHTVKSGEYLGSIATRYGVTVAQLKEWNGLRSDTIQAGQTLRIRR
ncbi:MAG: LysM peptidoglycan-binding domain-containing protein [Deltaproteobacteria bacterium]|nr:LysM peptidoglycan-binding domain-containing protein [Deltaproteobacteria bacterium]